MPGPVLAGANQALDSSLPTIFSEFKLLRDETGVMRSCATDMPLRPHEGVSKRVNNYGRVIATGLDDGVDMTQQQSLADTTTTYTPAEVGAQVILAGSTMRRIQDPDLLRKTGRMLSNAYDLKEDADGTAQLPSFVPIVGSAGTAITVGHANAAVSRLRIGNDRTNPEPAPEPWYMVLHPLHGGVLLTNLVPLASGAVAAGARDGMTDTLLRENIGAVARLMGATVKLDANIAVDANDDASGAVFAKEGLNFIEEVSPRLDPDTSDKSMRGAVELNLWGSYIWGLYRASNYGVEMLFDATLPTS